MRTDSVVLLSVLAITLSLDGPAFACKCVRANSVCEALGSADIVFAGRVEASDPNFDPRDPEFTKRVADLFPGRNLDDLDLDRDVSPETLAKLKSLYSSMFREPLRTDIRNAANGDELGSVIDKAFDRGNRVTFRVYRAYKVVTPQPGVIDVWTDFGDCACGLPRTKPTWSMRQGSTLANTLRTGAHPRSD